MKSDLPRLHEPPEQPLNRPRSRDAAETAIEQSKRRMEEARDLMLKKRRLLKPDHKERCERRP